MSLTETRVYRIRRSRIVLPAATAAVLLSMSVCLVALGVVQGWLVKASTILLYSLALSPLGLLFLWMTLDRSSFTLIVDEHRVTLHRFGRGVATWDVGVFVHRRIEPYRGFDRITLLPADPSLRPLRLTTELAMDSELTGWLESIPVEPAG